MYASDAAGSKRARVVAPIPEAWHGRIVYGAAVVAGRDRPAARDFLGTLRSDGAARILQAHGFRPVSAAPPGA